jgi:uncharacterized protein YeaO (DUF488 family)
MGGDHQAAAGGKLRRGVVINLKRAYAPAAPEDGFRVLVERLWPRGLKQESLALDLWLKDIAPSPELRR